jgi:hypothetical protein
MLTKVFLLGIETKCSYKDQCHHMLFLSLFFFKLIVCHWQKCAENLFSAFLDAKTRDFTCVYTIAFQTNWVVKSFIFSHRVILKNELTREGNVSQ